MALYQFLIALLLRRSPTIEHGCANGRMPTFAPTQLWQGFRHASGTRHTLLNTSRSERGKAQGDSSTLCLASPTTTTLLGAFVAEAFEGYEDGTR